MNDDDIIDVTTADDIRALPDGAVYRVPSGKTFRLQGGRAFAFTPPAPPPAGATGLGAAGANFAEPLLRIPGALVGALPSMAELAAQPFIGPLDSIFGITRKVLRAAGAAEAAAEADEAITERLTGLLPDVAPEAEGRFLTDTLPQFLGGATAFLGVAAATRNPSVAVSSVGPALLGGALTGQGLAEEARAAGADTDTALDARAQGFTVGLSEGIPAGRAIGRLTGGGLTSAAVRRGLQALNRQTGGSLERVLVQAIEEGGEEAVQEFIGAVGENVVAGRLYDDERGLFDDALTRSLTGLVGGTVAGGVFQGTAESVRALTKQIQTPDAAPGAVPGSTGDGSLLPVPVTTEQGGADTSGARTAGPQLVENVAYGRPDAILGTRSVKATIVDPSVPDPGGWGENEVATIVGKLADGVLTIQNAGVAPDRRGQGFGVRAYRMLVDDALKNGYVVQSDVEVTEDAAHIYDALERRGYVVERNPDAVEVEDDGVKKLAGRPYVFRVTGRDQATSPPGGDGASGGGGGSGTPPGGPELLTGAQGEGSFSTAGTETGRPELAGIGTSEEVRSLADIVDEVRKRAGVPEQQTQAQWQTDAEAALESDYDFHKSRIFGGEGPATMRTPADVRAARMIIDREGAEAFARGDALQIREAADLVMKYRDERTETARTLAAGIDRVLTPQQRMERFFGEKVFTPPPKTEKKMRQTKDPGRRRNIMDEHVQRVQDLRDMMREAGLDPASLDPNNPEQMHEALRMVQAHNAAFSDKAYEYWLNGILSLPTTQAANVIGNTTSTLWDYTAQRSIEAAVNLIPGLRNPDSPTFKEYGAISRALLRGGTYRRAWQRSMRAWRTESPVFEEEVGFLGGHQKVELRERGAAIAGKKGRVIRIPTRMLLAADEMAKSLIWDVEVAAQADRIARREGHAPGEQAYEDRLAALMQDPTGDAARAAHDKALELTFQSELGTAGRGALTIRRALPSARYVFPFLTTPINILKTGVRKSPLGALRLFWKAGWHGFYKMSRTASGRWQYERNEAVRDIAEQVLAWGTLGTLWGLVGDDDEGLPRITGSSSGFQQRGRRDAEYRVAPPQSIRIGDEWVSYARVEPLANILTAQVDMIRAAQDLERGRPIGKIGGDLFEGMRQVVRDKTFLQGLGDIITALEDPDRASAFASNFATSWVPNIVKGTGRAADPFMRDYSVRAQNDEWAAAVLKATGQKALPVSIIAPAARVDLWGRPIERGTKGSPATDFVYQMISPLRRQTVDHNPLDRLLLNWNAQNPAYNQGRGFWPVVPEPTVTVVGETLPMTDDEYNVFLQRAGQSAYGILSALQLNADRPTLADIEVIDAVLRRSRSAVRDLMIASGEIESVRTFLSEAGASTRERGQ